MRKKIWISAAIFFIVVFALAAFAKIEIQSKLKLQSIEKQVSSLLGMPVTASSVSFTWGGEVALNQVQISNSGNAFLSSDQIRVEISPMDLLRRKIVVRGIVLDHPDLKLDSSLIQLLEQKLKKNPASNQSFPVSIESGTISYTSQTRKTISIQDLAGSLGISGGSSQVDLRFTGQGGGKYAISGTAGPNAVNLKGDLSGVSLSELVNPFGKIPVSSVEGTVDGSYTVTGKLPNLQLQSQIVVQAPLFNGKIGLAGNLMEGAGGTGMLFKGKLDSENGEMEGLGKFKSLSAALTASQKGVALQNGLLSISKGLVNFSGSVGAKNAMLIRLASSSFSPMENGVSGSFTAGATGIYPNLRVWGTGSLPSVSFAGKKFKNVRFQTEGLAGSDNVQFNRLQVTLNGVPVRAGGSLTWNPAGNFTVHLSALDAGNLISLFGLPKIFTPVRMVAAVNAMYDNKGKSWSGNFVSDGGAFAGIRYDVLSATFTYKNALDFSGIFRLGHKETDIRGGWKGGNSLELGFTVPDIKPPLAVTGTVDMKTKRISFQGNLQGQDPSEFLPLLPIHLPPIGGSLYGDLLVAGVYPAISFNYAGEVKNAHFQNITVPDGRLTLKGTLPSQVSVLFHTDQLSLGSLEMIHQFVPIDGVGTLDVASNGSLHSFRISFDFPSAKMNGKLLGDLSGSMIYNSGEIQVSRLSIPITTPALVVAGSVNLSRHSMSLHSTLNGEKISNLTSLMGKTALAVDGNLYGVAALKGSPSKIYLAFSGSGKNLSFSGNSIGSASLNAKAYPSETGYNFQLHASDLSLSNFSMLQGSLPGLEGGLTIDLSKSGEGAPKISFHTTRASYKGKALADASGNLIWQSPLAKLEHLNLAGISPPIDASGTVNTQTHGFSLSSKLAGQSIGPLLRFVPAGAVSVDARLSGALTLSGDKNAVNANFSGNAAGVVMDGKNFGSGHLDLQATVNAQKQITAVINGNSFQAGQIALLANRYPGIAGNVGFMVHYGTPSPGQAVIDFSLKNASQRGRAFPELDGHAVWTSPVLSIAAFQAPHMNPPLSLAGSINTQSKTMQLGGKLDGQSIPDLMVLGGGSSNGISGNLSGPLTISGAMDSPVTRFGGRVDHLSAHGISLGSGTLDLVESKSSLDARFNLDHPIYLTGNLMGSLLSSIPNFGGLYNQLAQNKAISGVTVKGNPQNPHISLVFKQVPVAQQYRQPYPQQNQRNQQNQQPQQNNNPLNNILQQLMNGNQKGNGGK